MKSRRYAFVTFTVVALLVTGSAGAAETLKLTILHTSDLHGNVLPYDDARERPAYGSLARVSAAVELIRADVEHPVLLLDSGDTLQGTPLEEYFNVTLKEASPTIEAMNRIGYDAMAVGNHEFNFGLEALRRAQSQADFPFLSANSLSEATGEPAFPPFVIKELEGLRVGILGLTTPNIPNWESPQNYRGLVFEDIVESARSWVGTLRGEHGCDLVIVLAHTGFEEDLDTQESNNTAYENFGLRLVDVEGIDLLLTGHAHRDISPRKIGDVVVSQPWARGRRLTKIDLELERQGPELEILGWSGDNLNLDEAAIDGDLVESFESKRQIVRAFLAEPVAVADGAVSVRGCRLRDCSALDLIHEAQLAASGADISLASLLTDSTPDLAPGPVHRRWVRSLYVYANTLQAVSVTGAELKEIIEHSAKYYDGVRCSESGSCTVLTDPHIRRYNVDTLQGVSYVIDPTRDEGDRVLNLRRNGRPVDLHESFTLACNNYRAAGGGGFPHLESADVVWRSSREISDLLAEYLGGLEKWVPEADGNWVIAPQFQSETRDRRNAASIPEKVLKPRP